jgi:hypothetical protein
MPPKKATPQPRSTTDRLRRRVQDRPGRADRVSGRRSLTSTPSFGAGL